MSSHFHSFFLCIAILLFAACNTESHDPASESSDEIPMQPTNSYDITGMQLDSIIHGFIEKGAFPGASIAIGKGLETSVMEGYGAYTYTSEHQITPESIFDLASLTKVIATTAASMLLYEQGKLRLDAPVSTYLPEFDTPSRRSITIGHLLSHASGLPSWRPMHLNGMTTHDALMDSIMTIPLTARPDEVFQYSSYGMIVLAKVVEMVTQEPFDQWCATHIFETLSMMSTGFHGIGTPDSTIVPTEIDTQFRHRLIQGEVHDENAWIMGGVAGHAGLFSNVEDLSIFAKMMAMRGQLNGMQFLQPETIDLFTTAVDTSLGTRALGWDTRGPAHQPSSAGQYFGPRSFGHTGFTGTSIWIDPETQIWVILLTNRVHPTRNNYDAFRGVRGLVADIAYQVFL